MEKRGNLLYWKPRVLAAVYATVLVILSFDIFTYNYDFFELIIALSIYLTPALVVLLFLAIAWRYEEIGGALFIILGLIFMLRYSSDSFATNLIIALPLFAIGALFIANSLIGNKHIHLKERLVEIEKEIKEDVKKLKTKGLSDFKKGIQSQKDQEESELIKEEDTKKTVKKSKKKTLKPKTSAKKHVKRINNKKTAKKPIKAKKKKKAKVNKK